MICKSLFYHFSMKHILAPILLLVFLFPSLALSEEVTIGIEGISSLTQVAQLTGAPPAMNNTDLVNVYGTWMKRW